MVVASKFFQKRGANLNHGVRLKRESSLRSFSREHIFFNTLGSLYFVSGLRFQISNHMIFLL